MEHTWRLIIDEPGDGHYNMAVDEALLSYYPYQRRPTLRIYGWRRPCISIGYKQQPRAFLHEDCPFDFVRRITGGAAILHHKEITYSLVCAYSDLDLPGSVKEGYRLLCSFLKHFYRRYGLLASFAYEVHSDDLSSYGHSCFSNWHEFDMIIEGKKIGGNAQRRQKEIIFQQGSIPQQIDRFAMQEALPACGKARPPTAALDDLLGKKTDFFALQHGLAESFARCFGLRLQKAFLSAEEQRIAQQLAIEKYATKHWNEGYAQSSLV